MDNETVAIQMAELRGEVHAFNTIFAAHTDQDMTQFAALTATVGTMDQKLDELLLREAEKTGEIKGIRKMTIAVAAIVSSVVTAVSWAAPYIVG